MELDLNAPEVQAANAVAHRFIDCHEMDLYFRVVAYPHQGRGHKHHILPKSLFPEYKDCEWNIVNLDVASHILAHKLLSMIMADKKYRGKMLRAYAFVMKLYGDLSVDTFEQASLANRGENNPMFGLKGELNPNFGVPFSDERRKKISEALKGERHPNFGKKLSKETCDKRSVALKGRKFSDQHKAKLAIANKGKNLGVPRSEETKLKISKAVSGKNNGCYGKTRGSNPNAKKIVVDGVLYDSHLSAAESLNVNKCTLARWLKSGRAYHLTDKNKHDTNEKLI